MTHTITCFADCKFSKSAHCLHQSPVLTDSSAINDRGRPLMECLSYEAKEQEREAAV